MTGDLSFSARVAQQLAQIYHRGDCAVHVFTWSAALAGTRPHKCDCDRDQRVAEAVARAIEAGICGATGYAVYDSPRGREAALEALGASPQPETRP